MIHTFWLLISKVKKYVSNTVNKVKKKVKVCAVYKATRLGTRFNIKDKIDFKNKHNVVYQVDCPNRKCTSRYIGETKRRIQKRSSEHHGTDKQSHLVKHATETKHKKVCIKDFKIIGKSYRTDFTRKISESLLIKELKPDLNIQKDS